MTTCSPPQSSSLSLFKLCPSAQAASSLSVGLTDVRPPSMGFSSSHGVPVPTWSACGASMLSAGVGGLSAPPDGSACYVVLHMLTQCL